MSYRSSVQRAAARLSSLLGRSRGLLVAIALLAAMPGAAQAACGTMNVPDGFTTPSTSPMASGGSIVIDASRCDAFGLNPFPNPGTSNPSHGTVSVNTIAGSITYTNNGDGATSDSFVVEDASGNPFTVNVAIAAATSAITVSPASLPTPNVGTAYSEQLTASGGTAPYTYAVTGGSLAPGLSLSGDTISGTPNQAGGYSVTITVTDAASVTATKSYTVNVPVPNSSIAVAAPPTADLNTPYSYDLNANTTGALAPYTYSLNSGSLPTGLSLGGGAISGTPTVVGTSNFALFVQDSSPNLGGTSPGPYGRVVNLSITVQNVPPTAGNVSATVAYGSSSNPITLNVTGSAATSVGVATAPVHGTATASGTAITYTPTGGYAGPDSFTYTASNGAGTSSPATVTITVSPPTITYAPSDPAAATVGAPYSQSLAGASGGAAPYTYALAAGSLPAGLSLASNGTLSGTPTVGGTFNFSVTTTDSSTGTGPFSRTSASLALTVNAPTIAVSPSTLPNGTIHAAYSSTLVASGGTAPYSYAVTAGSVPAGLTLAANGALSGTPTALGTFNFTVTATDSSTGTGAPYTGSRAYTLVIDGATLTIAPASLPDATFGSAYSQTLTASGGTPAYTFALTGTLPTGLALAANGTLSGTPTQAGSFPFTATATDADGSTGSQAYTLVVAPIVPGAPVIGTATAGDAQATIGFTAPASDGGATITGYTVTSSPGGITATGSSSPLTVTGLTNGTAYTFTVTATNSAGTGAASAASNSVTPRGAQTITFANPGAQNFGTAPTLTASASSGLTVTFSSSTTAVCTITGGGALTFVAAGTCTIDADQAGDGNYLPAPTVSQSFTVNAVVPSAPAIGTATAGDGQATVSFSAPASDGGATITGYTVTSTPGGITATGAGSPITVTGLTNGTAYTFTVTADNSAGTGSASAASNSVTPAPTITLSPATLADATVASAYAQTLTAAGGSAPYTFTLTAGALPAGLALASDGTLSGTPSAGGGFSFSVTATDSAGFTGTGNYTLTVNGGTIAIAPATLPGATAGSAYSQTVTASGGTAPYTFAVSSGALPAGLTLAADGTLAGTPTLSGSFNFVVTATDSSAGAGPYTATRAYTLAVNAPTIAITPATLAGATVGDAYAQTIAASGGTAPYTFAVSAGALPAGLALATDGTLSGTPSAGGSFGFSVTGTDALGFAATRAYTLGAAAPTIAITPATLPGATAGSAYSQNLTASGGTTPYTFAVSSGALPTGLTLAADGTLVGTPSASGDFSFDITVTDSSGGTGPYTASRGYTLTVTAPTISITPATLANGVAGDAYSQALAASGGNAPYTFAVTAGTLPAGLTLTAGGTLSGTPTAGGDFPLTVTATDALGFSASRAYTLVVGSPVVTIVPATLPGATAGTAYAQQVTATGGNAPYTFAITAGTLPAGLALAGDGTLSGTPTASGSFGFTVTATDSSTGSGPYSAARAYTLVVASNPPVAVPDNATTLSGAPVDIAVTGNDSGSIDSIALAGTPQHGTATVDGLTAVYAPAAGFSGEDSFSYVAIGPGGTSAPATVTVTVHPVPVAPSRTLEALPGMETDVDLTEGATGGPFTGAALVALAPADAGTATITAEGDGWVLHFTPDPAFSGEATARFTLDNAFATSAAATITFQVQPRPDPSRDAQVRGLLDAQVESARRFAQSQLGNFRQRLEQLHGAGRRGGRFTSNVTFAERACAQATDRAAREECRHRREDAQAHAATRGAGGPYDDGAAQSADASGTGASAPAQAAFGVWAGGMIRSGSFDGRGGSGVGFESDGLSVGVDFALSPAFTVGAGLGYGRDDNTTGDAGSRLEGSARAFIAYASYHPWQHLFVDGTLGYQQLDYDSTRRLAGDAGSVRGRRDGDQWFASLSIGADLQDGALQFTPYARVDVARGTLDGYTEAGHPFLALSYGAMDIDSTTGNLGLRLDYRRRAGWGWFTPQLRLEYQREFADADASLVRYADLANGPVYTFTPSALDRSRIVFGLGATLDSDSGWSTRIEYQAAGSQRDEGVQVNVQKDF